MAEENSENEDSLLEIEVFRKQPPGPCSSNSLVPDSPTSSCLSSRTYRDHKKENLSRRGGSVVNHRNGCSHSTPLLGSANEAKLLTEYFSRIPLSVTPIAPHAADSQFEQDTKVSNTQWHRPVGRTLLDIATTYRSTIDSKLLEFDEIGFEASEHVLSSIIPKLFVNLEDSQPTTAAISETLQESTKTNPGIKPDPDVPTCILAQLSQQSLLQPRYQHKSPNKCENIPEDILANLHMYTDLHIQIRRKQKR